MGVTMFTPTGKSPSCWKLTHIARHTLPTFGLFGFPISLLQTCHSSLLPPRLFLPWEYYKSFGFCVLDYSHHLMIPSRQLVWVLDFECSPYCVLICYHRWPSTCVVCEFMASELRRQIAFFPSCGWTLYYHCSTDNLYLPRNLFVMLWLSALWRKGTGFSPSSLLPPDIPPDTN